MTKFANKSFSVMRTGRDPNDGHPHWFNQTGRCAFCGALPPTVETEFSWSAAFGVTLPLTIETDASVPPGTVIFIQDGKEVGRIGNIGK